MKIDFISSNQSLEVGSYRIWVNGVAQVLRSLNHDVEIVKSEDLARPGSVQIFSKGDYRNASTSKGSTTRGAINISSDDKNLDFDFLICGSIEEKKSLERNYRNVLIVNLIERMYEGITKKVHYQKDRVVLGFHGSYTHVFKMNFGFIDAFNDLVRSGSNIFLKVITDNTVAASRLLIDAGVQKERLLVQQWNSNSVVDDLREVDIGIVPNATSLEKVDPGVLRIVSNDAGLYGTDYFLRFKNKSNPGRAFVFIQLGIPVIADLTPSNMPLFYDEKCGHVAACKETWTSGIRRFLSDKERNEVAAMAQERFKSMYSFEKDVENLEKVIELCVKNNSQN